MIVGHLSKSKLCHEYFVAHKKGFLIYQTDASSILGVRALACLEI